MPTLCYPAKEEHIEPPWWPRLSRQIASPGPPHIGHSRLGGKWWAGSLHLDPTWPGLGGGCPNCVCRGLRVAGSEALHKHVLFLFEACERLAMS